MWHNIFWGGVTLADLCFLYWLLVVFAPRGFQSLDNLRLRLRLIEMEYDQRGSSQN